MTIMLPASARRMSLGRLPIIKIKMKELIVFNIDCTLTNSLNRQIIFEIKGAKKSSRIQIKINWK